MTLQNVWNELDYHLDICRVYESFVLALYLYYKSSINFLLIKKNETVAEAI